MDMQPGTIISYRIPGTTTIWLGKVLLYANRRVKVSIMNSGYEELIEWVDIDFIIGECDAISEDTVKNSN